MLKQLTTIGRYIKYDGKPPMSDDEIIRLTLIQDEKEKEHEALIKLAKEIKAQKEYEKKHAAQIALDKEELEADNELDYLDQMVIPCPKCGDDIMQKESKCTALACGKRQSAHVRAWQYSRPINEIYSYCSRPPYSVME